MSRFVIRPRAARDLEAIEEYVSDPKRGGPKRAGELIDAFRTAFRLLAKMPNMGQRWDSPSPHLQGVDQRLELRKAVPISVARGHAPTC